MLENPSATDPIRIDYYSLMRKWYVALYRYGLRLTYDIAIPEPGAAMREIYETLAKLQAQAGMTFSFALRSSQISDQQPPPPGMEQLPRSGKRVWDQASLPPPPGTPLTPTPYQTVVETASGWNFITLSFTVPEGYWITSAVFQANVGSIDPGNKDVKVTVLGPAGQPSRLAMLVAQSDQRT